MTEWTELPDFPRVFPSQCAPWVSTVRLVKGAPSLRGGKPETLRGPHAFLQQLEAAFIDARPGAPDVAALVERVLAAHARHIDVVEWCRHRGEELDLSLRVYGSRGARRLHLELTGPIGAYADEPLPERSAPARPSPRRRATPRATAKSTSTSPSPPPIVRVSPPAAPLILRPLVADARPSYGDPIAHDLDGRVHLAIRLPERDAFARVDPSGEVTVTPLATREQLREVDAAARIGAILPGVHGSAIGALRVDHYENNSGEQERIGVGDRWHAGRRGLYSDSWVLGVVGGWFLRGITRDDRSHLIGVHLESGKRARIALPEGIKLRGAAIDHGADGLTLRLLDGDAEELRMRLEVGAKVVITAIDRIATGFAGLVQPVPELGGWAVADAAAGRCAVDLVFADRRRVELFALPSTFKGDGYRPWSPPAIAQVAFGDDPRWRVAVRFGADEGPACVGAIVFAGDGRVISRAYVDADEALTIGGATIPLAEGEHVVGFSAGPTGDLAAALSLREGLSLAWAGPGGARSA